MTNPNARRFECEQHHAGLSVIDIPAAVDFYTKKLGFWLAFTWGDPPTFAGVNLGDVQIFLQQGTPSPQGCSVYFVVGDADELYEFQRANGVEVVEPPTDNRGYFAITPSAISTAITSSSATACRTHSLLFRSSG